MVSHRAIISAMNESSNKPDAPTGKKFGTKKDVAKLLGVSERSVCNLLQKGLPHLRITARCTRYSLADVEAWANRSFRTQRYGRGK